ncbi:MAG: polysaccharide deacetylase family protein [Acidobacteriota bacterium]|nr:polysaccharide deacetylase family protein [Acidobacteriota bacterium]
MNWSVAFAILLIVIWIVALLYYGCAVPSSQLLGRALVRGPRGLNRVALTFDDGPTPPSTGEILQVLKQYGVAATFFVNGRWVDQFPETLRRIHQESHSIGNHTYTHLFLYLKTRRHIAREIDLTQEAIERVTGKRPVIFRCPYGVRWFGLFSELRKRGMTAVQWSDTGYDWIKKNKAADIVRKALRNLGDGSVILLHDGCGAKEPGEVDHSPTVEALPAIIEEVHRRGFRFVRVEEFLVRPGESPGPQ